MSDTTTASSWCVIAKIREKTPFGEGGRELKVGSKHFLPGAKIYIVDWYPGICTTVKVVGYHRKSHRLMTIDLHVKYLTSLESKVVYKPYVVERIEGAQMMGSPVLSEEDAEQVKRTIEYWVDEETK